MLQIPKQIGLYVHLPWCVKKCPYCDFNSHQLRSDLDETSYIHALLNDFEFEINRQDSPKVISSIFIGGGTPSLFSAESIDRLLSGIRAKVKCSQEAEITLEANPGACDESRFKGYRQAGVNRLSLGIQSFNQNHLKVLGRVHDCDQALSAVEMAKSSGFENFNLDLMYCLPGQTAAQAQADVEQAISLNPAHISAYHLTIEPNTLFAHKPPVLPEESVSWEIQQTYWSTLEKNGYEKYEISAYSKTGLQSKHNLNYWGFGDYLGIGAGAHGKVTLENAIYRSAKPKHPKEYQQSFIYDLPAADQFLKKVDDSELPLEYMMNKLRLNNGFNKQHFQSATGLTYANIAKSVEQAMELGLLDEADGNYQPSEKGCLFLDDLLQLFLPDNEDLKQCCG